MHKDHFKQGMDHNAAKLIETIDRGMFEVSAAAERRSSYHHDIPSYTAQNFPRVIICM